MSNAPADCERASAMSGRLNQARRAAKHRAQAMFNVTHNELQPRGHGGEKSIDAEVRAIIRDDSRGDEGHPDEQKARYFIAPNERIVQSESANDLRDRQDDYKQEDQAGDPPKRRDPVHYTGP